MFVWNTLFCVLTTPVGIGVFVISIFSGKAEAVKAEVCDLEDEATIHNTVGWLEWAMRPDIATVQVAHTLETDRDDSVSLCPITYQFKFVLLLFKIYCDETQDTYNEK